MKIDCDQEKETISNKCDENDKKNKETIQEQKNNIQ